MESVHINGSSSIPISTLNEIYSPRANRIYIFLYFYIIFYLYNIIYYLQENYLFLKDQSKTGIRAFLGVEEAVKRKILLLIVIGSI